MERLSQSEIIKKLNTEGLGLFTIPDFKKIFDIKKDNTVYKIIERLTDKRILKRLSKGKYLSSFFSPDDYQVANFLYSPSYISLESALSFYGIITQFPYQITSVTLKKTKKFTVLNKEFTFCHIKKELFWGYEKKDNFLIALPEKALFDYLYFSAKGLRSFEREELDLRKINKKLLFEFIKQANNKQLNQFLGKTKL